MLSILWLQTFKPLMHASVESYYEQVSPLLLGRTTKSQIEYGMKRQLILIITRKNKSPSKTDNTRI